jgi:Matrixin
MMNALFKTLILTLPLMLVFSCSKNEKVSQPSCGFVQNIYGERISWKQADPFKLYISSSVPEELRPPIYRAAATWNKEIGYNLIEISEENTQLEDNKSRDNKNVIYFLNEWSSDNISEQARTSVYWIGDQIQEADIRINASDFSYYDQNYQNLVGSFGLKKINKEVTEGYSFEALVLHEMGHLLGLKHQDTGDPSKTVMSTKLSAYNNRVQLTKQEQDSIGCEYK